MMTIRPSASDDTRGVSQASFSQEALKTSGGAELDLQVEPLGLLSPNFGRQALHMVRVMRHAMMHAHVCLLVVFVVDDVSVDTVLCLSAEVLLSPCDSSSGVG